jgi:hypothetical protein
MEARSDDDRTAWHFALTRMTERECFARYNDEDLWTLSLKPSPQTPDELLQPRHALKVGPRLRRGP